jgi:hypothetical protein
VSSFSFGTKKLKRTGLVQLIALHFSPTVGWNEKQGSKENSSSSPISSLTRSGSEVLSRAIKNITLGRGGEGGDWEIRGNLPLISRRA